MFWRRKDGPPAQEIVAPVAPRTPVLSGPDPELETALDAVAEILRARARYTYAVDAENPSMCADHFEAWAKHILVRTAPPNVPVPPGEDPNAPVADRDWRGLVDFVQKRARRENDFVSGTVRDMRDAIYSLVESISKTSGVQGKNDAILRRRISALGAAVETGSIESLKREAVAVADAVTKAIEEQRQVAEAQNADLKARLESLGEQLEQTRKEGDTDALTRVANRRAFDIAIQRQLTIAGVVGRPLTLVMVDVDHFKSINDTHGHPGGDEVLRALADAMSRAFPRRSDLVARYGGEEFALLLPDTGEAEVAILADRLLNIVRSLRIRLASERTIAVTVSAGCAVALPNESAAELITRADRALYSSKRAGRNRWCVAPAIAPDIAAA